MIKHQTALIIIGFVVIAQGIIIGNIFSNPYPCTTSGIGCSSWIEAFLDTWSVYYLLISVIIGLVICNKWLFNE